MREEERWCPIVKIQIARRTKFIGPGCYQLLGLIRDLGSVRLACERMSLSYSKAWRILNTLEGEAGFAVLTRKPGGKSGGETHLTPDGERLMARYAAFEAESMAAVNAIFARHFPEEAGL